MSNIEKPLISIIVPSYKQAEFLSDALDSVLAQTCQDWECIIVDDGSPDNTGEVARKYLAADRRFKYIRQENGGAASARNAGVRASSGKYILPLDGDDKIAPEYLAKAREVLDNRAEVKVVYCLGRFFGEKDATWIMEDYSYRTILIRNMIGASSMYRRSDFDRCGGYDERLKVAEDWEFWISLLQDGGEVVRLPETLFFYRYRSNSKSHTPESQRRREQTHELMFKKHIDSYLKYFGDPVEIFREWSESGPAMKSLRYRIGSIFAWPLDAVRHLKLFFGKK